MTWLLFLAGFSCGMATAGLLTRRYFPALVSASIAACSLLAWVRS